MSVIAAIAYSGVPLRAEAQCGIEIRSVDAFGKWELVESHRNRCMIWPANAGTYKLTIVDSEGFARNIRYCGVKFPDTRTSIPVKIEIIGVDPRPSSRHHRHLHDKVISFESVFSKDNQTITATVPNDPERVWRIELYTQDEKEASLTR